MNIFSNLSDFLIDKKSFLAIYENDVYVYGYDELIMLDVSKIIVKIDSYYLDVVGSDLCVKKLDKKELILNGLIKEVIKRYE